MSSNQGPIVQADSPFNLSIPSSDKTVSVFLIDSGALVTVPRSLVLTTSYEGLDKITAPAYSFLITHPSGRRVLFDLGVRKDWQTGFAPSVLKELADPDISVSPVDFKDIPDVLVENGMRLEDIHQVMWSHHHWDHTGDMSLFPGSTDLVVGPGFKEAFGPGWPAREDAPVKAVDWEGRKLIELDFNDGRGLKIGRFSALDYWGDGSFYVLDTPGHALGHVSGLARVEKKEFVLLGGDIAHHPGEFRPSPYIPLPASLSPSPFPELYPDTCPGRVFASLKPDSVASFYRPSEDLSYDAPLCEWSIEGLKELDASNDILVVTAHDSSFLPENDSEKWTFPERSLTGWKKAGLKERLRWKFLKEFKAAIGTSGKQHVTV